jgi:hypothetical protein
VGNHGGTSEGETSAIMVFMSPSLDQRVEFSEISTGIQLHLFYHHAGRRKEKKKRKEIEKKTRKRKRQKEKKRDTRKKIEKM